MTLPTFLGIGVMRGGTTWLHELLASHPEVYVPTRRKEIYYFDLYYDKGIEWYQGFFPGEAEAVRYRALGEITPTYFYRSYGPERIAAVPSISRLLLILRNPVDRAYSHYSLLAKNGQVSGSFEDFLSERPDMIENGFYSRFLKNYQCHFEQEQILVMIYERATAAIPETKETLARFLGVAPDRFPLDSGRRRVNRSYTPRLRLAYALARRTAWYKLRYQWNLDWIVNWGKQLGIEQLFGEADSPSPMKEETRKMLQATYHDEIRDLASMLQTDLSCWA